MDNSSNKQPPRILVVDDQETARFLATVALQQAGFEVAEAESGAQALAAIERTQPDLILLDVVMPEMDGFTFCELIRANPELRHLPVLMMTGLEDEESINRAFDSGATDFIGKPFSRVVLPHRVRYILRAHQSEEKIFLLAYHLSKRKQAEQELRSKHNEALAMEKELRLAQKLEAVGQLSAGVAHEINTPTQYVSDNINFLQESFTELVNITTTYRNFLDTTKLDAITPQQIEQVQAAAQAADLDYLIEEIPKAIAEGGQGITQIAKIINAMKAFSHPGDDANEPVDLNSVIENSVIMTRNEWKFAVNMVTCLDDSIPKVIGDAQAIGQVLLNLIINAAHAIAEVENKISGELGTITISTRQFKDQVQICVSDTGPGIPDSIREKVFDPFFTTKSIGKGTGQGLALARRAIVDRHGGTLDFQTDSGKGTIFTINLYVDGMDRADGNAAA